MPVSEPDPALSASRSLAGTKGAHTSWARTPDPAARTAPARRASWVRFEREVDPDGTLDPEDRARRAGHARSAWYAGMQLKSMEARRKAKQLTEVAALADAELDAAAGDA